MGNTYFTSDTHYGHKNILKFCPESRPFTDVDEMNEALVDRWNAVVNHDDEVYHLGDVSFTKEGKTLGILSRLNGTKYLVEGNHDKLSPEMRAQWAWVKDYHELKLNGKKLIMFHYPIEYWNGGHYKGDRQTWHLHGHSHGGSTFKPGRLDVGVDTVWSGHRTLDPWSFEEVAAFMEATKDKPADMVKRFGNNKGHHE